MMNKQIISLIGGLVAAGVLVLAFVVGVVPQLTTANSTNAQAAQVDATNQAYQAQITHLQKAKETIGQTEASVAQLHTQISAEPLNWQIFRQIAVAADAAKATVESIDADDPVAFVQQTAPVPAGSATPAPTPTPVPSPSASTDAAGAASTPATVAPTTATTNGRLQVPFTISVTVPDAQAAITFMDGLRKGPRLIGVVTSTATSQSADGIKLDVDALAFAEPTKGGGAK
jgi:hypothetical protein